MKDKEWHVRQKQKKDWERGEWDNEPDKMQYTDQETGYPCLIVRQELGFLCGYVGVPKNHPAYKKEYSFYDDEVEVHGGLTFAGPCVEADPGHGICHLVEEGEDDDVWWLGFDCYHAWDFAPGVEALNQKFKLQFMGMHCQYRNIAYVKAEIKSLAAQLKKMELT